MVADALPGTSRIRAVQRALQGRVNPVYLEIGVSKGLLVGVKPVDQGDVDGALLEEGRLVGEEAAAISGRISRGAGCVPTSV